MDACLIRTPSEMTVTMRLREQVLETRYSELLRCDFPIGGWNTIPVEIPLDGSSNHFGRGRCNEFGGPTVGTPIRMPAFSESRLLPPEEFLEQSKALATEEKCLAAATPVFAIATSTHRVLEDFSIERYCSVLFAWSSGTAIVVTLDWKESNCGDGDVQPEWHIRSSQGLSLIKAFETLARDASVHSPGAGKPHKLFVSPSVIAEHALGQNGVRCRNAIWSHEWNCQSLDELREQIGKVADLVVCPVSADA
ncbi:MAG TPA: hypothetical protein PLC24_11255 [Myxococcota bacterium]|nr:hypothetical protein [Myxococcota bacterium]HPV05125.1 hypothetical protein [Myxococcota bacterium]